jgi:hypothetical protein
MNRRRKEKEMDDLNFLDLKPEPSLKYSRIRALLYHTVLEIT